VSPVLSQNGEPRSGFEEKWVVAVRAANRRIADVSAKRLLADRELASAVTDCISETPLPQLQTLSWLRGVLLRLAYEPKRLAKACSRRGY